MTIHPAWLLVQRFEAIDSNSGLRGTREITLQQGKRWRRTASSNLPEITESFGFRGSWWGLGFGSGFCCGIRGERGWLSIGKREKGVEKVATLLSISSRFWNDYETAFSVVFTLPRYTNSYIYIGRWSWFFGKADWGNTSGGEIYFRTKENANWTVSARNVFNSFAFCLLFFYPLKKGILRNDRDKFLLLFRFRFRVNAMIFRAWPLVESLSRSVKIF